MRGRCQRFDWRGALVSPPLSCVFLWPFAHRPFLLIISALAASRALAALSVIVRGQLTLRLHDLFRLRSDPATHETPKKRTTGRAALTHEVAAFLERVKQPFDDEDLVAVAITHSTWSKRVTEVDEDGEEFASYVEPAVHNSRLAAVGTSLLPEPAAGTHADWTLVSSHVCAGSHHVQAKRRSPARCPSTPSFATPT